MGAQPTKLYTELGSEWIEKVHHSTDDPETTKAKHLEIIPKIEKELEEIEQTIIEGAKVYHDLTPILGYGGIENENATRARLLIELSIQRDLEKCVIALKDYLESNSLDDMHKTYKDSLPNFNEMASKYILQYNFHKNETAFNFWIDGNLHYLDVNHPAWQKVI